MKKIVGVVGAGLVVAGACLLYLNQSPSADDKAVALQGAVGAGSATDGSAATAGGGSAGVVASHDEGFYNVIKTQLMSRFGTRLESPFWRVKMLRDVKLFFQKQYPDNWEEEYFAFLRFAFPEKADELIARHHAIDEYEQWVSNLKATGQFSSQEERRQALWDKRLALFGDDAYVIWEAEFKAEQFNEKLVELAQSVGSYEEKQQQYVDSLKSVFGADAVSAESPNKDQKMIQFLALENVQQDLHSMSREQQTAALRSLRTQMGLDEEALTRWDTLDAQRADQRSKGDLYTAQRQTLSSTYSGAELDAKLDALRRDLFGEADADFIRKEELSGYYRFAEPQQIGIN